MDNSRSDPFPVRDQAPCINGIKEVAQDPVFHGAHQATESRAMRELPELKTLESELTPATTH